MLINYWLVLNKDIHDNQQEGGEVAHYEVLSSIAKDVKNKKFGTSVRGILKEEKGHLTLCTNLAKSNAASE